MMDTSAQLLTLLFGFALGFYLYEVKRYKVGGVIAVPILVLYTLQNSIFLPIFGVASVIALFAGSRVAERTLYYGRRLLYCYLAISIVTTSVLILLVSGLFSMQLQDVVIFTIFPGIIAYNLNKESFDLDSAGQSIALLIGYFLAVYIFALALSVLL